MRWSELRTRLLPRSGIGVVGPWLITAPPDQAIVALDLRLLSRVEKLGRRWRAQRELLLACGAVEVTLHVADGEAAVDRLVAAARAPIERVGFGTTEREAQLSVIGGGLRGVRYPLVGPELTLGRSADNAIILPHGSVAQRHAVLAHDGGWRIRGDVRVNDEDVADAALVDGDVLGIGQLRVLFTDRGEVLPFDPELRPALERMLFVDQYSVSTMGNDLIVGTQAFRISEVEASSRRGATVSFVDGNRVHAALLVLVVAAGAAPR